MDKAQGPYDHWTWSVCKNVWLALNEEFDSKFDTSIIIVRKVQMM